MLKIVPLGGMGKVTQNMFLYEYEDEILIVDCGIGFPDMYMPGVDVMIPDITFLLSELEQGKHIAGMVLSHGHDDHIAALPYILPQLPEFPIYGSPLTAAFAENRMQDTTVSKAIERLVDGVPVQLGSYFKVESMAMTHSVPDTKHLAITTPEGLIYHGADFKLDETPIDGVKPDYERIKQIGEQGVLCMLMDCLRVERSARTLSEAATRPAIEAAMAGTKGKFIVTLMSSHIHRIQQVIDVAAKNDRKIVFVGRSVEQNVETAILLKKLHVPQGLLLHKRQIEDYPSRNLCVVIAGSQGQEGSSLVRAIYGEHPVIRINQNDKVIFSADAIPGNEIPYYQAIDELCRNGVDVLYPDIVPDLHESGHASAVEQRELLDLVKPKYVMPIGGADRHRAKFVEFVAEPLGYNNDHVLRPAHGDIVGFANGQPSIVDTIQIKAVNVDGLGVGDVGPIVLSDRLTLGEAGVIVLVIPKVNGDFDLKNVDVVSRGFVFMKEAEEVVQFIKEATASIIDELGTNAKDDDVKRTLEKRLGRRIMKIIRRTPMILPVIVNV
jgi:ribonuclease J